MTNAHSLLKSQCRLEFNLHYHSIKEIQMNNKNEIMYVETTGFRRDEKLEVRQKITDPSGIRTRNPLLCTPSALSLSCRVNVFKSVLKDKSFARNAPLSTNLHRGAITAPLQCAFGLPVREDCSHQGGGAITAVHRVEESM